jgi:diadenosine tetraphosphatase ApaH/serine/threonine PP2A family protein phosphatase
MLVRVLSDVHANMQALEAVLEDRGPGADAELTVCLGDVTGYGADPVRCIEVTRDAADLVLMGNHDSGICGKSPLTWFNQLGVAAIEWQRPLVEEAGEMPWIADLPLQADLTESIFLCHAFPPDPGSWHYVLHSHDAIRTRREMPGLISIVGHTHLPCVWLGNGNLDTSEKGKLTEETCIVNCGSVGQPRDGDPRAAYLLLDTDRMTFRHVRVKYDTKTAAERISTAGLPEMLARRLFAGR